MLVLTRKTDEAIRIGDDIVIKVVQAGNNTVKIGIEAPRSVAINREEVYQRIQKENRAASAASQSSSIKGLADMLKQKKGADEENHPKE
ncbi:MAG: carbon storage regulator CsrA [Fibrobacterota bacterium]